ncbi:MAG: hypothetical protein LVR00_03210 [Rhabdochlamydiaceae bacterium]|jgi:hypothetical protein
MRLKPLLYCHLAILFLLGTFFWGPTRVYWDIFDVGCFKFLNGTLKDSSILQTFWALANHKLTDWVEDLVFIVFLPLPFTKSVLEKDSEKPHNLSFVFCLQQRCFMA